MRIDLRAHERIADEADKLGGWYEVGKDPLGDLLRAKAEHVAANGPRVTRSLIARIRELEYCLADAAQLANDHGLVASCEAYLSIVEKGAVLL